MQARSSPLDDPIIFSPEAITELFDSPLPAELGNAGLRLRSSGTWRYRITVNKKHFSGKLGKISEGMTPALARHALNTIREEIHTGLYHLD